MNLIDLECFVAVAREKHFTRAARALCFTPSNVSQRVRRLEAELGGPLFVRNTHEVRLSELGTVLLADATELLETAGRIRASSSEFGKADKQVLKFGYVAAYHKAATCLVRGLRERLPEIHVEVYIVPTSESAARAVESGELTTAIACPSPGLEGLHLFSRYADSIVVSDMHPLAGRTKVDMNDLEGHTLLLYERSCAPFTFDLTTNFLATTGLEIKVAERYFTGPEQMLQLVAIGEGFAFSSSGLPPFPGTVRIPLTGGRPPIGSADLLFRKTDAGSRLLRGVLQLAETMSAADAA
jgi:DNA-binding transcriptional LysR family regulator